VSLLGRLATANTVDLEASKLNHSDEHGPREHGDAHESGASGEPSDEVHAQRLLAHAMPV